jgi:two-component system chemotaxis response regulator CheB
MSLRVLIVDDSVVFRRLIADAFAGIPGTEVVGIAFDGRQALARMTELQPDLVTLDIEMPEMSGIEVLGAMNAAGQRPGVIVLSSLTVRGGEVTMRALELGAFDFVTKPEGGRTGENLVLLREQLLPIVQAFGRQRETRLPASRPSPESGQEPVRKRSAGASSLSRSGRRIFSSKPPLVLVGVSTGGPAALSCLLPGLPADIGAPVFIVQHMPALFTQPLAESLNRKSAVHVKEGQDGEIARPNCVYLAPGGRHMRLAQGPNRDITINLSDDPPENGCKPAVDQLFRSAALQFPGRSIAVILTGMGNDGTAGLRMLRRGGCLTIAQDEASCVVFGMPKEAIDAGVIDIIAPLNSIAETIARSIREGTV